MDVRFRRVEPGADGAGRAQDTFVEALENGDATAASASYTPDARLLAPSAELFRGRPAIERFWQAGVETGIAEVQLETIELVRGNGLAYEIGRYAHGLRPRDGAPIVDRGAFVRVHEQQADGSWLWALEMFSPGSPAACRAGNAKGGLR